MNETIALLKIGGGGKKIITSSNVIYFLLFQSTFHLVLVILNIKCLNLISFTKILTSETHAFDEVRPWSFVWPWPAFIWSHVAACTAQSLTLNCLPLVVGTVQHGEAVVGKHRVAIFVHFWFLHEACRASSLFFFFGGWMGSCVSCLQYVAPCSPVTWSLTDILHSRSLLTAHFPLLLHI